MICFFEVNNVFVKLIFSFDKRTGVKMNGIGNCIRHYDRRNRFTITHDGINNFG